MNAPSTIKAFTDAAADAVGREIARLRAEAARESELRAGEYRARTAELETRLLSAATLERELKERLTSLKDGEPGKDGEHGKDGRDGIDGTNGANGVDGRDGEPGRDGRDGIDGQNGTDGAAGIDGRDGLNGEHGKDGAPGRDGTNGENGTNGRDGKSVEDITCEVVDGILLQLGFTVGDEKIEYEIPLVPGPQGEPGEPGNDGPVGKLEAVEPWADKVHYEGAIRTHGGATWQALRDTAKEPPFEDWACIAAKGADGLNGRSFELRETWQAEEQYRQFEVVTLNASSFVARKDNPGPCPGPDWKLIAGQGKTGRPGERGPRGEPGPPGPKAVSLQIDAEGVLTLTNADGSTVTCDLYPLLSRIDRK